jgi:hypothetical protein
VVDPERGGDSLAGDARWELQRETASHVAPHEADHAARMAAS